MGADEGFCGRQGQCRSLGQQSQWRKWGTYRASSYVHTASVSLWTKGLLSSFHPCGIPHWNSSWLPWLPGYLKMIAWNGITQNLCLWPPYIYLLRTMRSHTLQSDWLAKHSPSNGGFGVLDITMNHCAHQHWLVGAEAGHDTTFSPLTPLCVWFWGVVIQGHGVSSHDPQTFLQCPLFFDVYVPLNTPASFIPVWTSTKHLSLQISSSESSSHFIFWQPSS